MAVTWQTPGAIIYTGNNAAATVAPVVPYPGTVAIGDLLVLVVGQKPNTTTMTTPSNWTLLGSFSGGAGTTGSADVGPTRVVAYTREVTAANVSLISGNIPMGTVAGQNVSWGQCLRLSKTLAAWDVAITGGVDTAVGAAWSVLMGTVPAGWIAANDHLIAATVLPTDSAPVWTVDAITAQGGGTVTLPAVTAVTVPGTTNSLDIGGRIARWVVTSSTQAAGTITHTATHGTNITNNSGPEALIRIRDYNPPAPTAPTSAPTVGTTEDAVNVTTPATLEGGADSYNIYRNGTTLVASGRAANTTYADTGASRTSTQTYTVRGVNVTGTSSNSPASSSILAGPGVIATFGTGEIYGAYAGTNEITVSWQAKTYDAQYDIYRNDSFLATTSTITGSDNAASFYTDTDVVAGNTYNYKVATRIGSNVSSLSSATFDVVAGNYEILYPDANVTVTNWTGGFADVDDPYYFNNLRDAGDTAFTNAASATFEVALANPVGTIDTSYNPELVWAARCGSGTSTVTGYLVQGTTVIATGLSLGVSTSPVKYEYSLTSGERASITNWNDLRIRLVVSANTTHTAIGLAHLRVKTVASATINKTASDTLSASATDVADAFDGTAYYPTNDTFNVGDWEADPTPSDPAWAVTSDRDVFTYMQTTAGDGGTDYSFRVGFGSIPVSTKVRLNVVASVVNDTGNPSTAGYYFSELLHDDDQSFSPQVIVGLDNAFPYNQLTKTLTYKLSPTQISQISNWNSLRVANTAFMDNLNESFRVQEIQLFVQGVASTPITASDTLSVSVTDTGVITNKTLTASDTLSATVVETSAIVVTRTLTDTLSASVTETTAFATIPIAASDTLSAAVTDAVSATKAFATVGDNLNVSLNDQGVFGPVPLVATDTLSAAVTDLGVAAGFAPAADTLIATVTETANIVISGLVTKVASDTLTAGATEGVNTRAEVTGSDTLSTTLTLESGTFPPTAVAASDNLSVSVTDVGVFSTTSVFALDALSLGAFENGTVAITSDVKTASDTLSAAVTETAQFATVAVTAADTLSGALTESVSFATVAATASDTLSATITESVIQKAAGLGADTLTVQLSETTDIVIGGTVTKSASDALNGVVTDTSALTAATVTSDDVFVNLTEGAPAVEISGNIAKTAFDNTLTSVTESVTTLVPLAVNDALNVTVADNGTFATVAVTASDTLSASVLDLGVFSTVNITAADALNAQVTESSSFATVSVVASDALSVAVTESVSFGTVAVSASDTLSASATDNGILQTNFPGQDFLNVQVADVASVVVSGISAKTASDTLSSSVTETAAAKVIRTASDTLSASVADVRTTRVDQAASDTLTAMLSGENSQNNITGTISKSAADAPTVSVTETSATSTYGDPTADTLTATVTETVDIQIGGIITKSGLDAPTASVTESVSFATVAVQATDTLTSALTESVSFGTTAVSASDNLNAAATESISFATVTLSSSDTLVGDVTETNFRNVPLPASDTLAMSLTETANVVASGTTNKTASDTLSAAVVDTALGKVSITASDLLSARVTDAGTFFLPSIVTASDTLSAAVNDTGLFSTIQVSSLDTLSASVTDTSVTFLANPGQDNLVVIVTETANIVQSGTSSKAASDTLTTSVADAGAVKVIVAAFDLLYPEMTDTLVFEATRFSTADTLSVQILDTLTFATTTVTASDVLLATLTETSHPFVSRPGEELLLIGLEESASVIVLGGVNKESTDDLIISLDDTGSVNIICNVFASDDLLIHVTEVVGKEARTARDFHGNDWIKGFDRVFRNGAWTSVPRRQ